MNAISVRKAAANRANAKASTGPRTAAGKARAARNAMRHGLCSDTRGDPEVIRAIERFGRELAGSAAGEERTLAYRVAAAQVDLERAGQAQRKLFCDPRIASLMAIGRWPGAGAPDAADTDSDPDAMLELLCDIVYELEVVKRYEDRAFGRRRRAIQALDGARTGKKPPPHRMAGIRLPRSWRLPSAGSTIIRFEGLPRWTWWRPDPLTIEPRYRRGPGRRNARSSVPAGLDVTVDPPEADGGSSLGPGRIGGHAALGGDFGKSRETNPPAALEPAADIRHPPRRPRHPLQNRVRPVSRSNFAERSHRRLKRAPPSQRIPRHRPLPEPNRCNPAKRSHRGGVLPPSRSRHAGSDRAVGWASRPPSTGATGGDACETPRLSDGCGLSCRPMPASAGIPGRRTLLPAHRHCDGGLSDPEQHGSSAGRHVRSGVGSPPPPLPGSPRSPPRSRPARGANTGRGGCRPVAGLPPVNGLCNNKAASLLTDICRPDDVSGEPIWLLSSLRLSSGLQMDAGVGVERAGERNLGFPLMGGKRRTLIVEDDAWLAMEIEQLLEEGGFAPAGVAADAAEAFRLACQANPDWALVDLHLRDGLTGPEIGRRLAGEFHVPVLYVTADARSAPLDSPGIIGLFPKIYYGPDFIEVLKFVDAYLDGDHRLAAAPRHLVRPRS